MKSVRKVRVHQRNKCTSLVLVRLYLRETLHLNCRLAMLEELSDPTDVKYLLYTVYVRDYLVLVINRVEKHTTSIYK